MLSNALNDLEVIAAAVGWLVTVVRVGMVTQANSRLLWVALLTLTVGQTLQVEGVYRAVEETLGSPGSAAVIKHGFALFAAANTVAVVGSLLARDAPARNPGRTWAGFAIALAVSILPWLVDPPTTLAPSLAHRAEYYDPTWRSGLHWAAFLGYLGWTLWVASRLCWRFRRVEAHAPTRAAVTLVGLGTTIGLGYIAEKAVTVLGWLSGHGPALVEFDQAAEAVVLALSVSLIAIGTAYEAGWNRLDRRRCDRQLRAVRKDLAPFVAQLRREFTDIETPVAMTPAERLVAEVAVIHEGLRRLTAYAQPPEDDAPPGACAVGLHGQAGWLHRALTAKATQPTPSYPIASSPVTDSGQTVETARYLTSLYAQAGIIERKMGGPPQATAMAKVGP